MNEKLVFSCGRRVPDGESKQEPVTLPIGELHGPGVLEWILRREHNEWPWEGVRRSVHRDLPFAHRLQEGGL